jgi:hypothetical protein
MKTLIKETRRNSKSLGASSTALAGYILQREIGLPVGLCEHRFQHHRVLRHDLLITGCTEPQTRRDVNTEAA